MRGMTNRLTIGERVAWYRRRRGMSQEVLAGLVARTVDWLSKVENNRIELDRLSVIKALADALDISLGDLIAEPSLMDWTSDSGTRTVPALRAALMDYRLIAPFSPDQADQQPPDVDALRQDLSQPVGCLPERPVRLCHRPPARLPNPGALQPLISSTARTGNSCAQPWRWPTNWPPSSSPNSAKRSWRGSPLNAVWPQPARPATPSSSDPCSDQSPTRCCRRAGTPRRCG